MDRDKIIENTVSQIERQYGAGWLYIFTILASVNSPLRLLRYYFQSTIPFIFPLTRFKTFAFQANSFSGFRIMLWWLMGGISHEQSIQKRSPYGVWYPVSLYHFVWVTKYRYEILQSDFQGFGWIIGFSRNDRLSVVKEIYLL